MNYGSKHKMTIIWTIIDLNKIKQTADIKKNSKIIDDNWCSLWQVWTTYDHLIFGRVSISINYSLIASGSAFNTWLTKIMWSFFFFCNIANWLSTTIVCHNFTIFKLKQLLTCHQQRTNPKFCHQIEEKNILIRYFLVFLRIFFLVNDDFSLQWQQ